ncbi:hypothetical protein PGTDC60_0307 [Porphyromonas gingivalis TDC60]|nr:hypothetical protein PGTDC60_0307 [Porphyromonas gingivalis TDC60]
MIVSFILNCILTLPLLRTGIIEIPGHVFRKTRATFFSLWRENYFLPEPKRKFSRATFLGTHNRKILEPKEYRGSHLLFREFLLR